MGRAEVILLDTHVFAWLVLDPQRLSKNAISAIRSERKDGGLAISAITLYEMAGLSAKGRIDFRSPPEMFFRKVEAGFIIQPITGRICAETTRLPDNYPRDPMDRLIAATAIVEGLTLVTADAAIQNSRAVPTIW
jgi:PIN domain nuclease of toxin-antitoxin system